MNAPAGPRFVAMPNDARRHSPSTARNRDPILGVLRDALPPSGLVLEIASGTGEHAVHFAAHMPKLEWQPSDADPDARASIAAWRAECALANLRAPLALDVATDPWPVAHADAVVCINMIHIAPWNAAEALIRGAARILPSGGVLFLYGPYRREGRHTAPSNEAFDRDLRQRNPKWGVRDLEQVVKLAADSGLNLSCIMEMPANNLSIVLTSSGHSGTTLSSQ
jgi:SAM-dependent methyltransferase